MTFPSTIAPLMLLDLFTGYDWLGRIEAAAREEEVDLTRQYTLHPALTQTSLTAVLSSRKISHKI